MEKFEWYFKELLSGEPRIDNVGGEFFSLEALKDEALPREACQNSLDQVIKNKKLKIKISIFEESSKSFRESKFLKGLYPHCSSNESGIPRQNLPNKDEKFRYMLIEDFNTTGVIGSIDFNSIKDSDRQNFFHLFRSIGMTSKDKDNTETLGSWGMGKNTYAQESRISTFLGYSSRVEKPEEFITGMSILKLHTVGDTEYKNIGNFGIGNANSNDLVMPVTDSAIVQEFKSEFNIVRGGDENGLSLVIPFLKKDVNGKTILKAFIKTWALAILKDKMELHLKTDEFDIKLNKDTIYNHLEDLDGQDIKEIRRSLIFIEKSLKQKDFIELKFRDTPRPIWRMESLIDNNDTENAREILESSEAHVSFRVPLQIAYNDKNPKKGAFEVHIFRDKEISNPFSIQYYRHLLLIPGVVPDRPLNKPYHAIVIVDDELANILAKAEGPAHYQWSDGISKFQHLNLKNGKTLINFVRNSANQIKAHLNQSDIEIDEDIAAQILGFRMPENGPGEENVPVDDPTIVDPPSPPPLIERSPSPLWNQLNGGFSIKDNPATKDEKVINKKYSLIVSYEVEEGNAKSFYTEDQFDFRKPPLIIAGSGIEILTSEKNIVEFIINERGWSLEIKGFDTNRELEINLN